MTCTHENIQSVKMDKCCGGRIDPTSKMVQEFCLDCRAIRIIGTFGPGQWMACKDEVPCDDCAKKREAAIEAVKNHKPCKDCEKHRREENARVMAGVQT
jgi:hypothetical protein